MTLRWYAVYTHAFHEDDAAQGIVEQGWRTALPLISYDRKRSRRVERVTTPLFRRYCFAEFDTLESGWQSIAHTKHVAGILPLGKSPGPIRQGIVEGIMAVQDANGGAIPREEPVVIPFQQGETVTILEGPFFSFKALVKLDEGGRVRVMLDLFGRSFEKQMKRESIARG